MMKNLLNYLSTRIFGFLLHWANKRPDIYYKSAFYDLKRRLIKKFGKYAGFDIQRINKECWTCEGTGIYDPSKGWNWTDSNSASQQNRKYVCRSCGGTGWFKRDINVLDRFKFGRYLFHTPLCSPFNEADLKRRLAELKPNETVNQEITHYITHPKKYPNFCYECHLWLGLLFDWNYFKKVFGRSGGRLYYRRYPLLFLSTLVWNYENVLVFRFKKLKKKYWTERTWLFPALPFYQWYDYDEEEQYYRGEPLEPEIIEVPEWIKELEYNLEEGDLPF